LELYFVAVPKTADLEVIKALKPPRLLLSYYHWKNKSLEELFKELGYKPKIMWDSGAWTAYNTGKNIALIDFMKSLYDNHRYIDEFISLDVIGDPLMSKMYYDILVHYGLYPIPVYHYGDEQEYLDYYVSKGNRYIALGGTAGMRSKPTVAKWAKNICEQYPTIKFHLLGSSSKQITDHCNLFSCDSSTWIMQATMGYPKEIKGTTRTAKIERAKWQMNKFMEEYK
jgi:hypothetical protein